MAADDANGAVDEQEEWLSRITDAPTYRPTAEEFEDPIKYICVHKRGQSSTWRPDVVSSLSAYVVPLWKSYRTLTLETFTSLFPSTKHTTDKMSLNMHASVR